MPLDPFLSQSQDRGGPQMPQLRAEQRLFNRRYELRRLLGVGGMGVVWLARDHTEEIDVALKFLPSVLVPEDGEMKRLREEVRAGKELRHPRLVATYGMEVEDGIAAIVMEFVSGQTLKQKLNDQANGFFEPEEITSWIKDMTDGLGYLHEEAKRIHRDLKPANVIIDAGGRAKLMDFGISHRIKEGVTKHSKTHEVAASSSSSTLAYASPQQISGKPSNKADDIYSLGATIYELLTGTPPFFRGGLDAVRGQIKDEPPTPIMERRQELVEEGANRETGKKVCEVIVQAVMTSLAKAREKRLLDAAAVWQSFSQPTKPAAADSNKANTPEPVRILSKERVESKAESAKKVEQTSDGLIRRLKIFTSARPLQQSFAAWKDDLRAMCADDALLLAAARKDPKRLEQGIALLRLKDWQEFDSLSLRKLALPLSQEALQASTAFNWAIYVVNAATSPAFEEASFDAAWIKSVADDLRNSRQDWNDLDEMFRCQLPAASPGWICLAFLTRKLGNPLSPAVAQQCSLALLKRPPCLASIVEFLIAKISQDRVGFIQSLTSEAARLLHLEIARFPNLASQEKTAFRELLRICSKVEDGELFSLTAALLFHQPLTIIREHLLDDKLPQQVKQDLVAELSHQLSNSPESLLQWLQHEPGTLGWLTTCAGRAVRRQLCSLVRQSSEVELKASFCQGYHNEKIRLARGRPSYVYNIDEALDLAPLSPADGNPFLDSIESSACSEVISMWEKEPSCFSELPLHEHKHPKLYLLSRVHLFHSLAEEPPWPNIESQAASIVIALISTSRAREFIDSLLNHWIVALRESPAFTATLPPPLLICIFKRLSIMLPVILPVFRAKIEILPAEKRDALRAALVPFEEELESKRAEVERTRQTDLTSKQPDKNSQPAIAQGVRAEHNNNSIPWGGCFSALALATAGVASFAALIKKLEFVELSSSWEMSFGIVLLILLLIAPFIILNKIDR